MGNQGSKKKDKKQTHNITQPQSKLEIGNNIMSNQNVPQMSNHFQYQTFQKDNPRYSHFNVKPLSSSESFVGNQRSSLVLSPIPTQSFERAQSDSKVPQPVNMKPYSFYALSDIKQVNNPQIALKQVPDSKIIFTPDTGNSILRKDGNKKVDKKFAFQSKTIELDELRFHFRAINIKLQKHLNEFGTDISRMNDVIQSQRQIKLKDKNKVLFLLKQKSHYQKICEKFKEYNVKIKDYLLSFRKNDTIIHIGHQQFIAAKQTKIIVEKLLSNIQNDLPQKSWKILLQQPGSSLYNNVVNSASKNAEIMKKYKELEESLTNPKILQQIAREQMMNSTTWEMNNNRTNNFMEGRNSLDGLRNTKYPVA